MLINDNDRISAKFLEYKISKEFYEKDTVSLAKSLLGKVFVRVINGNTLSGIISETEAYLSKDDYASHSASGESKRNSAMFMRASTLYVYKIYGIHHCINVVSNSVGIGEAVLIRSMLPLYGIDLMKLNRGTEDVSKLLSGPGNISKALAINLNNNKSSLLSNDIFLSDFQSINKPPLSTTPRIGISKSMDLPLRFIMNLKQLSVI